MSSKKECLAAVLFLLTLTCGASALIISAPTTWNARTAIHTQSGGFVQVDAGGSITTAYRTDLDGIDTAGTAKLILNGGTFTSTGVGNDYNFKHPDNNKPGWPCSIVLNAGTFSCNEIQSYGLARLASISVGGGTMFVYGAYNPYSFIGASGYYDTAGNWYAGTGDGSLYPQAGYRLVVQNLGGDDYKVFGQKMAKLSFALAASSGLESVTPALLTVNLTNRVDTANYLVDYAVVGGTATGGGVDYTRSPGTLTFTSSQTSKTISITINNDGLNESDETIIVALSNPRGTNAILGDITTHTYTILDPRPGVAFNTSSSQGMENVTPAQIPVSLSSSPGTVTVNYAVTGGTAVAGQDYILAPGTLTFTSGVVLQNIPITLLDDVIKESPYKTIQLTLSNPSTNVKMGSPSVHTFTIIDDELLPTLTNSLGMEFSLVHPGAFTMGAGTNPQLPDTTAIDFDEQPAHLVTLTMPFYILKAKVAQAAYLQSGLPGTASDVSWNNAQAFCQWLSSQDPNGRTYRLPTEAEWEYVCKNPGSVTDMSGREWVNDWHGTYPIDSLVDPNGPAGGILKVIRTDSQNRYSLPPMATSSPWGLSPTAFRIVMVVHPPENPYVSPQPFNQCAVKQSTAQALQGPNPAVPYFTVRFAIPIPPDNDRDQTGPLTGLDQSAVDHNHSPAFEILPNGDALAVWFSGVDGDEYGVTTRLTQARLRYGAEQWDMPELFYKIKGYNDESPLLWREGNKIWLFGGGRNNLNNLPFKVLTSTNNGATWQMSLPYITGSRGGFTPQPITNAFRSPAGYIYFGMDGAGDASAGDSFLWRSTDDGITWNDTLGRTYGRHSTIVPINSNTTLLSLGGKNTNFNGYMPQVKSTDWGSSWTYLSATPFAPLGSNQRPCLIRMANGKLAFCSDAQNRDGTKPASSYARGCIVAISSDEGVTWTIKNLPVTLPHESDRDDGTLGYSTIRQAPNGVLHVLTTMTNPCLHYEFNEAWVFSAAGDVLPETTGGTVNAYSENYPGGQLKCTWSARVTPGGRYLLDGTQTSYYPSGLMEHQVTYQNGRRDGDETFWAQNGTKISSWQHDATSNTSTWIHWFSNGLKRVESTWKTYTQPPLDSTRYFHGLLAHGPAYHWNRSGTAAYAYNFSNGSLTGPIALPAAQTKTADLTGNGCVDLNDLYVISVHWLWSGVPGGYNNADIDFDGQVDDADLVQMASQWLNNCP